MEINDIVKHLGVKCNVQIRVIDNTTKKVVRKVTGHNSATHTMLVGTAHYLCGDGVLNQGYEMLSRYIPKYISLGTMGLFSQDEDESGLPVGIGNDPEADEETRFTEYINQSPGFGADGYSEESNSDRVFFGLGPKYSNSATDCELISDSFPRSQITYRVVLPESQSELPETIDVVYSAFISTGALKQFRSDNDYIFITETGLWSSPVYGEDMITHQPTGTGLLAGYRIIPSSDEECDMSVPENRQKLKQSILRVGKNQIVQIIWKIQIGIGGAFAYDSTIYRELIKIIEDGGKSDRGVFGTSSAILINDFNKTEIGIVSNSVITSSTVLTSPQSVSDWLNTNSVPKYFDSVVFSNNVIICSQNGHSVMTISDTTITVYKSSNATKSVSSVNSIFPISSNIPTIVIEGDGGIMMSMLGWESSGYRGAAEIIITKDNNNETTVIASTKNRSNSTRPELLTGSDANHGIIVVAWGDNITNDSITSFTSIYNQSQMELVPFVKCQKYGSFDISYTPYVFYIPSGNLYSYGSEYASSFAEFTLNNKSYYTNGYWAVRKEI